MEPNEQQPSHTPETNGATVIVQKLTVVQRTRQVLAWLLLILLFLAFATLIFVQLPVFKRIIVSELVKSVESSTNGTLTINEVKGNILQGFVMNDVTLTLKTNTKYDTVPFLHADHILASYSLIRWLRKNEFGITNMVIEDPVVRFVKFAGDTTWNFTLLTKPVASAPKGPPTPFTQIVDLASMRIANGKLIVRDYNYAPRIPQALAVGGAAAQVKENAIDWANIDVEGIDLDSRFYAHGSTAQSARVSHLRFTEKQSGFFVQHLEFSGYIDSIQARMDDAKITTGHSDVGFSFELSPPKIITTGLFTSIQHSSVRAKFDGPVISTYELKQFLPKPLGFLAGSPGIHLDATGEFGKLHVKQLALDFKNRGSINIAGDLLNLHHTDSLEMNLSLEGRNLSNATLVDYVPGLHLPNLSRFGNINIASLTYGGAPLNFHTAFDAKSSGAGAVKGDVVLDIRHHGFNYRAGLRTTNFNLAALINKPEFESSISTEAQLKGTGTNWRTLNTDITMKLAAPSTFDKYKVNSLDLSGTMDKGALTVRHMDATVEGGPEVHVRSAWADLVATSLPYKFDGTIKDLALSKVLGTRNPARVDLDATIAGTAKNFEDLTGTAHARLFDLVYKGQPFQDVIADLKIAPTRAGENSLKVSSQLADITIDHRFRLGDLIHTVPEHVNALLTAIKNRDFPAPGEHTPIISNCADSLDFDYFVRIKDLRPLADFFPQSFLLAEGVISGSAYGCPQGDMGLIMNGDSLSFILRNRNNFDTSLVMTEDTLVAVDTLLAAVRSSDTATNVRIADSLIHRRDSTLTLALAPPKFGEGVPRVHITPTHFRLVANNISDDPHEVLDHLNATFTLASDSIVRLGSALLYHPNIDLAYKNQTLNYDLSTVYNDVAGFRLKGNATFPAHEFDFALDTIRAFFLRSPNARPEDYVWMNEGVSHLRIADNGLIALDTLRLLHPLYPTDKTNAFAQRLSLGGTLLHDSVNAWTRIPSFDIEKIGLLLPWQPKNLGFQQFHGRVRDVAGTLQGTLERPEIALHMFSDSLRYGEDGNQITFDSNAVDVAYRDQALRGNVTVHVANVQVESQPQIANAAGRLGTLQVQIDSIPMTIALKRGPTYATDSAAAIARPLSASINTSRFPLDVATPFVPIFTAMQGTGDIHFKITGTREHTIYSGNAGIQDAAFLLAANNMWYRFNGGLDFANNSLRLDSVSIRNIDADDPYGAANLTGNVDFSGFSVTNFDLRMRSQRLMVLSNESKKSLNFVYGPLTINTDGEDFHFYNTLDAPTMTGTINIMSARLTMPQSGGGGQNVTSEGIVYRTEPNDSLEHIRRMNIERYGSAREALDYAVNSGSPRMTREDDSLFSNRMKNIYMEEDGTIRNADSIRGITAPTTPKSQKKSFADRLRMNLRINTQGDISILVPFSGVVGILGTQMQGELAPDHGITIERGDDLVTHAVGELELTQNSTFRFIQTFNITTGRITFTNDFTNPELDVVADYTGTRVNGDPTKIELAVTGTKNSPKVTANIYENQGTGTFEQKQYANENEAFEQALYFLTTNGSFKEDLSEGAGQNVLANLSTRLSSQLLADMVDRYVGSSGSQFAIRSAQLQFGGGAQLAVAYRNITFKYSTEKINDPTQAEFVTDIPLTIVSNNTLTRNMMIELQYHTNETNTSAGALSQQPQFLTKVIWTPWRW